MAFFGKQDYTFYFWNRHIVLFLYVRIVKTYTKIIKRFVVDLFSNPTHEI